MGTKVHSKSYLPGYYSMRDLNEDSSSSSWPLCYGDKPVMNGQYYNGFTPRPIMDDYPGHGKDALKQKMLEHEAVFKNQVYELHRLYRIQRDLMEEAKRKELIRIRASMEPSSSSSLRGSQMPLEDARKWHMAGFPLLNSGYERTSISRVEIVNSPMSCTKGNNTPQPGQFPFQNGSSLKDSELLDSRPLKVRKKLFDLELPADEYIDTEDDKRSPEYRVSDVSSYTPNGNLKSGPESRVAESASTSRLRNSVGLADLNEPIEIEEATAPSPTDFHCHRSLNGGSKGVNLPAKSNAGYLGVNGEVKHQHDGFLIDSSMYEAGPSKNNLNGVFNGLLQDKSPIPSHHPVPGMLNSINHPRVLYPTGHSKEDLWRDKSHHGLESSSRSRYQSNNGHLESHLASEAPHSGPGMLNSINHPRVLYPTGHSKEDLWRDKSHHGLESSSRSRYQSNNGHLESHLASEAPHSGPFFNSYFSGSWAHSVPSWAKPMGSFAQNVTTLELRNGFYHGSASGQKELNRSRGDNVTSDHTTNHGFGHFKNSCDADSKPTIDINLNEVVPGLPDVTILDEKGKPEDHLSALPWLKNKPAHATSDRLSCKAETVTDLNQPFTPPKAMLASSERKIEISEDKNVKKILGFPIFETDALRNEPSSHVSTSASARCPPDRSNVNTERKNLVIDINLECEPEELIAAEEQTVEKVKETTGASVREFIDLNSCVTDCEDAIVPSYVSKSHNAKTILDIDLESPVIVEKEDASTPLEVETKIESPQDEVLRNVAETILAISSSCPEIHKEEAISESLEASLAKSLVWFVDAVSSCANELKDGSPKELCEELDDFEAMTLQIPETKEEDYMPTPFVPEALKAEDTGTNTLPTRPRRGQSRRGRQRRDFQRDILPGLSSLSRHEVTEDIQTFGGLMRATGHQWISGLARRNGARNGGGRGRRRAVVETVPAQGPVCTTLIQQLNSIEAGLEDRSLTGWGKTTRRPRRQRCPAGNPPAVVIT